MAASVKVSWKIDAECRAVKAAADYLVADSAGMTVSKTSGTFAGI